MPLPTDASVLIGTRYDSAAVVVPVAVGLLTGGFAVVYWLLDGVPVLLTLWAAVSAACVRYAGLELWRAWRGRQWLRPTAAGFEVIERRGTTEHADASVADLAVWHSTVYDNGLPRGRRVTGSLTIKTPAGVQPLPLEYDFGLNVGDPLGLFLGRVTDRLVAQANHELRAGGRLIGDGWCFSRDGLTTDAAPDTLPASDITAVRAVDGSVCVWRTGVNRPAVRLPVKSANVGVLVALLERIVPPADESISGLGRELFRRDMSVQGWAWVRWAAGLGCFLVCGGLGAVAALSAGFVVVGATLAVFCLVPTGAALRSAWRRRVDVFRCHERGVAHDKPRRTGDLRYEDCGGFRFVATDSFSFGQYQGTSYAVQFWSSDPADGPPIACSWSSPQPDPTVEGVRDLAGKLLAERMLARLAAGETVPWAGGLVFRPDGLAVGGGRVVQMVPYRDLDRVETAGGACQVYGTDGRRPLARVGMSERNAYPGLLVLQRLLAAG